MVCVFAAVPWGSCAHADELDDVKAKLTAQLGEVEQLSNDIKATKEHIEVLDDQMKKTLDEIADAQAKHAELQSSMSDLAVNLYKDNEDYNVIFILGSSESLSDVLRRLDMSERVLHRYADLSEQTRLAAADLNQKYRDVSAQKDTQRELLSEMKEKSERLDSSIADLRKREKLLSVEQQAKLAQAAAASRTVAQTFETGTVGDDELDCRTGLASAYGGSSDSSTPNPGITATGTVCDDWSVGVAVPMAWGAGQYYGLQVEISYGGQSIIAPVVDCGNMDSGRRALDLQPGVFKAFGCSTCDEWGVREVKYRFL